MKAEQCRLLKPVMASKDASVKEVAKLLCEKKQRRCVLIDSNQAPVGIVSVTDMSNKVVAEGLDAANTKASDVMVSPIHLVIDGSCELEEVYTSMQEKKSYFVPITKEGKLYGILTYAELMRRAGEVMTDGKTA